MSNNLLEAALQYAADGLPVFPCRADKKPFTKRGVIDATTDPRKIKEWWNEWPRANIGCDVGGAGLMALDFDPGYDIAELEARVGKLPVTKMRQKSPRGGEHWFYAIKPDEIVSPSASKLAKHVDVRSFNSYVLLTPSATADGEYTWISEGKPAFRPDRLVAEANSHRAKSKERDVWLIEADLSENVADAIEWLKHDARIAVEGQGGDHCAYATAAMMKSYGISEQLAFDLIWEHWNPRCSPPWSSEEAEHLEAKVKNGYSYNTSPPGNVTNAYRVASAKELFKPVREDTPTGAAMTAGRFRFVDREGMRYIPKPRWIIEDTLTEKGYGILYGKPGTFKTFIALDMALTVATGQFKKPGLWTPDRPGRVIMCVGEGRAMLRERVIAWEHEYYFGRQVPNFILADPVPLVTEDLEGFIEGALAVTGGEGYDLAIIDTIGRAMQGANENAQQDASKFTQMVEAMQRNLGCAVLALHHAGHSTDNRARGSSVFPADADTVIQAERDEKSYTVALRMDKQKDAQEWDRARWVTLKKTGDSLVATQATEAEKPARSDKKRQDDAEQTAKAFDSVVCDVLESLGTGEISSRKLQTIIACHERCDVAERTVRKYLEILRSDKSTGAHARFDPIKSVWRAGKIW